MWTAPDDALLAGFGAGDGEAATAFIRRHQSRVFGLALAVVGDPVLAEDVSQEAFTRAWRHAGAYDPRRGSVPTWLLTITRNLAIDAVRLRRSAPVDPATFATLVAGPEHSPQAAAERADDAGRLRAALADLPENQRRALVLAAILGRTAQEVSDAEGIPLGTAKTRIRSAMTKMRVSLGAKAGGGGAAGGAGATEREPGRGPGRGQEHR